MNIYVMVDAEGLCGIFSKEQVSPEGSRYNECREHMTREVNIVVEALKEAGVERVYVRDAHSAGNNVYWDKLSDKAYRYIVGNTGTDRFPGLDDCDGVILLGYHAMAGTRGALLEHSMSSSRVQNYWINDMPAGEVAIDAGIAGDKNIPVIMVSGDDYLCKEVKQLLPWAVACEVKKAASLYGIMTPPMNKAFDILREGVKRAVDNIDRMNPLVFDKPITFKVEVMERCPIPNSYAKPYLKIIDGRTYEITAGSMEEALFRSY
ncbi:MAG TPA: M55 family metallopeptidase [Clostridia bacterium]|nr:M55 family metallopeptidase [Clostridia bacterium]